MSSTAINYSRISEEGAGLKGFPKGSAELSQAGTFSLLEATKMKIAYISGPYSASLPVKLYNIWLARSYAKKYWKLGYAVICPHSNSALFDKVLPHDTFIRADKALVRASDLIVLIGDWVSSKGAVDELWEAVIYGKHCIFESLQDRGKTFVQRILKLAWGDSHDFHSCLVCKPGTKADDLDSVGEGRVLYSIHHGILQETPSFEECGRAEADGREAEKRPEEEFS